MYACLRVCARARVRVRVHVCVLRCLKTVFGLLFSLTIIQAMGLREQRYGKAGYQPSGDASALFPGTFYLAEVSE